MSKNFGPRFACALFAAALALPLAASSADAQTRYGAGPGDFNRGEPQDFNRGEPQNRSDYNPRSRREPGIVLYSRTGFGGRNIALDGNMPDLRQIGFNDRASSLRVNWGVWEVCRDINFGGGCSRIDRSVSNFGRLDEQISSVRLLDGREHRR